MKRSGGNRWQSPTAWLEGMMAAIALANLTLVAFDWSYIRFRDQYLQVLPQATVWYGERFKGMEPERTTVSYLALVDDLEAQLVDSPEDDSLDQPPSERDSDSDSEADSDATARPAVKRILAQLSEQSVLIVDEDPFAVANKSGTLERIKNLMRSRMGNESSKKAFREFWNATSFEGDTATARLAFFNREIRPLMETNYFRGISESGRPIDLFWQLDIWFMALFATEFLGRTWLLSRRQKGTTWLDAMFWRMYDVPMFIGFWRWLRILPVSLRMQQAHWANLEPIRNRLSRALVSQFAVELTEIVLLRLMDQAQRMIRDGDVSRLLNAVTDRNQYIDINGVDEVQTIAKTLADVVVYQVLPQVKPELDALLQHSVVGALNQAPAYQGLKLMPGFDNLSQQISHQVVAELSKTLNQTLQNAFSDEQGAALTSELIASFGEQLAKAIQQEETLAEVRSLAVDLLEEIKINYVERIASEGTEQMQAARYRIYGTASIGNSSSQPRT